jgi:hypothetical protein
MGMKLGLSMHQGTRCRGEYFGISVAKDERNTQNNAFWKRHNVHTSENTDIVMTIKSKIEVM